MLFNGVGTANRQFSSYRPHAVTSTAVLGACPVLLGLLVKIPPPHYLEK